MFIRPVNKGNQEKPTESIVGSFRRADFLALDYKGAKKVITYRHKPGTAVSNFFLNYRFQMDIARFFRS